MAASAIDAGNCKILLDNCFDPATQKPFIMLTVQDVKMGRTINSPVDILTVKSFREALNVVISQLEHDLDAR